jgi:hypothetical protein
MLQNPAAYYAKYGGGGGDSFNDRFSAAPAITPGLQPQGGDYSAFPNAISAGVDPSRNVNVGNSSFNSRFGAWPDPATPMYTPGDFPGWTPSQPSGASRSWDGSVNTPEASALMLQNPAAYYAKYGGGAGMMASGGDTSWIGAGGSNNDYNPFGQINSGQVGQYDPFMGYQPQPTFDQRYGSWGGQPYGPGYFDNTFGSVSQNGPGSFNSRFPWPNTPGMTSSDQSEAARQQAIQDLMRLLGTTVAPAYDPHVAPDVPSTLVPGDYRLRDTWTNAS